jgi:UDP-GlcNAc:undecaprenyl-phosphate GlcNAc-1-phosphate transferase
MYNIIVYLLFSFLFFFLFAKTSYKLNLVDLPNNRKIHSKPTSYAGGISISVSLLFSILLFDTSKDIINIIISISFLVSLIGLIDDKFHLNPFVKLSIQIIPIFYLVIFQNLTLNQLGNYDYFVLNLEFFKIPLTLTCVLFLINSFNYFDGMDGTLSFVSISTLAILYFLIPNQNFHKFLIIILVPLVIFLFFNFSFFKLPKMFLGDSGSLTLGFIISFILIYLANNNFAHPILLAWSVTIFVYEFLSINLIRIKNNKKLFKAAQDHLHHILFKITKSLLLTNFLIVFINIILFIVGYFSFKYVNPLISLILFISFFFFFLFFRNKYSIKIEKLKSFD